MIRRILVLVALILLIRACASASTSSRSSSSYSSSSRYGWGPYDTVDHGDDDIAAEIAQGRWEATIEAKMFDEWRETEEAGSARYEW